MASASTITIMNDTAKKAAIEDDFKKYGTRVFKKSSPNGKVSEPRHATTACCHRKHVWRAICFLSR